MAKEKEDMIKRILLTIFVAIIFSSLVFMFSTSVSKEIYDTRDCNDYYKANMTQQEQKEIDDCRNFNNAMREKRDSLGFILNVVVVAGTIFFLAFKKKLDHVDKGLLYGALVVTFFTYVSRIDSTIANFVAALVAFVAIMIFLKKKKSF